MNISRSRSFSAVVGISFGVIATLALPNSLAQDETPSSELRARQLFYTSKPITQRARAPIPKPSETRTEDNRPATVEPAPHKETETASVPARVPSTAPYLALRYSVMQPGPSGDLEEVDPEKTFHSGDRFRLKLTSNSSAYLYVVMQGSQGNWEVLYPLPSLGETHQRITAGEPLLVPPDTNFQFDKDPGTERLFVVMSRNPETSLGQLIQSVKNRDAGGSGNPGIENVQIASLRQRLAPRGIVREHVTRGASGGEDAVYVANVSLNQNSRVITDIVLKHE